MKQWKSVVAMLVAVVLLVGACAKAEPAPSETAEGGEKLKVVASFHAMEQLVRAVGGDWVEVSTVVPAGSGAHGFEPKAQDWVSLESADLFVYNGQGMETWVDQALEVVGRDALVVVDTSEGVDLISAEDHEHAHAEDEAEEPKHEDEAHAHGPHDPHLWLGLSSVMKQAETIQAALSKADRTHAAEYEANTKALREKLQTLMEEARATLASAPQRKFVTGHAAFAYLCRDLELEQVSIQGIFAEGEPTAKQLAALVEEVKEEGVTTIFSENLASPAVSETLAREVGAKVEKIYTLEAQEDGLGFIERIEHNLKVITASLSD